MAPTHPTASRLSFQNGGANEGWGGLDICAGVWADQAANESARRANLLSLQATRTRHVGSDPNVGRHIPISDRIDGLPFSISRPARHFKSDLTYDYRTNVEAYPKWQAWMRARQPRLLVIWGRHDASFDISEPEAYRGDVPDAQVHIPKRAISRWTRLPTRSPRWFEVLSMFRADEGSGIQLSSKTPARNGI